MGHICNQIQCWSCFELLGANISRILGPSKVQAKQHHNIRPHVGQRKVYLSQSPTTTVKWKRNEQRWTKYIKQVNCRLITLRFYMFHALNWNNPNVSQCLFQFRSNLCSFLWDISDSHRDPKRWRRIFSVESTEVYPMVHLWRLRRPGAWSCGFELSALGVYCHAIRVCVQTPRW